MQIRVIYRRRTFKVRRLFLVIGALSLGLLDLSACAPHSPTATPVAWPTPSATLTRTFAAPVATVPLTPTLAVSAPPLVSIEEPPALEAAQSPRLIISKIKVDEAIVSVPITNGQWAVETLGQHIGWLTTTGRWPGDAWALALVAHVNLSAAERGPFANLWRLRVADEVIYRVGDTEYVYAVREKVNVPPEEVKRLYVRDGKVLLLLTCTDWDYINQVYTQRLLVRAEFMEQRAAP